MNRKRLVNDLLVQECRQTINKVGVTGAVLLKMPDIFMAEKLEVLAALRISETIWRRNTAKAGMIVPDETIALLARFYIFHPEFYPYPYRETLEGREVLEGYKAFGFDKVHDFSSLIGRTEFTVSNLTRQNKSAKNQLLSMLEVIKTVLELPKSQQKTMINFLKEQAAMESITREREERTNKIGGHDD